MEANRRMGFIEKYFGSEAKFSNFLFKGLLVFVIAQQIYYPQELKYFHLAVLFMYMIFLEFFKDDHRAFYDEYVFTTVVLGCGVVSILEDVLNLSLSIPYLVFLLLAISYAFKLVMTIYNCIKIGSIEGFADKDQKMLEKGTRFMKGLLILIMSILISSFLYGVYRVIIIY